jgi:hypothetical protein
MVLYLLIALVAVVPNMIAEIGVLALPLRVEAMLLTRQRPVSGPRCSLERAGYQGLRLPGLFPVDPWMPPVCAPDVPHTPARGARPDR